MTRSLAVTAWLTTAATIGCGTVSESTPDRSATQRLSDRVPMSTLDEALSADHVRVYGTLDCADSGRWELYAWRISGTDVRGVDGLPTTRPELATKVDNPGAWSLPIGPGPRRVVAARNPRDGRLAVADPHARAFPVAFDLEGVDLVCGDAITPAEDGSTVVSIGRPVVEAPDPEESIGVPLAETALGKARTSGLYNAARQGQAHGAHTEAGIRKRYADQLDDDAMHAMMPLLVQLADDPGAADQLVANTLRDIEGPSAGGSPHGASSASHDAPTGFIEIHHGGH